MSLTTHASNNTPTGHLQTQLKEQKRKKFQMKTTGFPGKSVYLQILVMFNLLEDTFNDLIVHYDYVFCFTIGFIFSDNFEKALKWSKAAEYHSAVESEADINVKRSTKTPVRYDDSSDGMQCITFSLMNIEHCVVH